MSGAELWERLAGVAPMMLRALLADLRLLSFDGTVARVACPPRVRAVAQKKADDLAKLAGSLTGGPVRFDLVEADREPSPTGDGGPGPREHTEPGLSTNDAEHPVVRQALETFNGRILDIKPVRKKPDHQ